MICKSHPELSITSLPYSKDAALSWFTPLSGLPWAMILRSAATTHPDNRYDILVADPLATIETQNDTTYIKFSNGDQRTTTDDPFKVINTLQSELLPPLSTLIDLPFIGGTLGYFSYDLGRRVEKIATTATHDIPLPEMAVGLYDWALIVDHQLQQSWLIEPKNSHRLAWLTQQQSQTKSSSTSQKSNYNTTFQLTSSWSSNMTKEDYCNKFNTIQSYLLSGDCYQINLAQRFSAHYQGDEWQAYCRLETANGAPFSSFIRTDNGAILSVSPERFLQLNQSDIETKPIKGTRPRSSDTIEDAANALALQQAPKDRAENVMIVDLLRNDIGRVAVPGSVRVPALFAIESFPAVHHLVSTVTGQLASNYSATDLLRACFPGGSITGAPKVRAMEIIEELEPNRRSIYCGSIGYISRCGTMDTNIAIRTLVAYQHRLYAWAGGGIVADSNAESEYQETLDKLSKILPTL
ncbi:aminodeoxychorismate synthase component 1 [Photobacterium kishitanii]|uniref:aminodeoxychorismate synthase component 1 n=1 Tax=Photobacterium kishitanii TaxID=318456 RepID=UPI0007F894AB|nr:aminodeoxychorismate synthase component 1 [Photobacterium kishitanii]OBU34536.1 aminodeoxychorismate synthase, component I [Photobacterium kishitanii]PSU24362.1 aminodeoxychorismate synthase component 1 [Photobacterium kishitanii]PSV17992.1 aminodeoxychorismate synthase component 1 [Photobacterium kishitanii]PSW48849.1 aminodeoxychorismate synthase component 1 [Photobacterium kishitanii]